MMATVLRDGKRTILIRSGARMTSGQAVYSTPSTRFKSNGKLFRMITTSRSAKMGARARG
jgi:hypothetical protein